MPSLRPSLLLAYSLATIAACNERFDDDRDAWVRSAANHPAAAAADCAPIASDDLRGDCKVDAARRLAATGERGAAQTLCDQIELSLWQAECWFLVSDTLALSGPEAVANCAHTRGFRTQCLNHAVRRQIDALPPELHAVGREHELVAMVERAVDAHHVDARPTLRHRWARSFAAGLIAERWSISEPLDAARCGTAPERVCIEAVRIALKIDATDSRVQAACDRGLNRGLPPLPRTWTEISTPYVRAALDEACRAGRGPAVPAADAP